jgi:hypothetical protein
MALELDYIPHFMRKDLADADGSTPRLLALDAAGNILRAVCETPLVVARRELA